VTDLVIAVSLRACDTMPWTPGHGHFVFLIGKVPFLHLSCGTVVPALLP
jgi:hypothetical protein